MDVNSYPFTNRHALTVGLCGLLPILTAIVISTYASINRDPILSRTIDVKPGRLESISYDDSINGWDTCPGTVPGGQQLPLLLDSAN